MKIFCCGLAVSLAEWFQAEGSATRWASGAHWYVLLVLKVYWREVVRAMPNYLWAWWFVLVLALIAWLVR